MGVAVWRAGWPWMISLSESHDQVHLRFMVFPFSGLSSLLHTILIPSASFTPLVYILNVPQRSMLERLGHQGGTVGKYSRALGGKTLREVLGSLGMYP